MLRTRGRRDELRFPRGTLPKQLTQSLLADEIVRRPLQHFRPSNKGRKIGITLTGEVPHLRVLPRARLCQDLARRNALQALGDVPVERIATAGRGGGRGVGGR